MRKGMEALDIDDARLKELGFEGFAKPIKITCKDHAGAHAMFVQQWDGKKWNKVSDWIKPMTDVVRPMLEEAAERVRRRQEGLANPEVRRLSPATETASARHVSEPSSMPEGLAGFGQQFPSSRNPPDDRACRPPPARPVAQDRHQISHEQDQIG